MRFLTALLFRGKQKFFLQNGRFCSWFSRNRDILLKKMIKISDVKVDIASLGLSSKNHNKISWNFLETAAKFRFKMAEARDEDFSGTRILWGSRNTSQSLEFQALFSSNSPISVPCNLFYSVEACYSMFHNFFLMTPKITSPSNVTQRITFRRY